MANDISLEEECFIMVSRNVKLLGIVCIALLVVQVAVIAYFEVSVIGSLTSEIADRDHQIAQLSYENSTLHNSVASLNDQVNDLNDMLHLYKSQVVYNTSELVQYPWFSGLDLPAFFIDGDHNWVEGGYDLGTPFDYAGYIIIQINSTSDTTYINYTCASPVGTFSLQRDIGMSGRAVFPVLPLGQPFSPYPAGGIFWTVSTHTAVPAKIYVIATYVY